MRTAVTRETRQGTVLGAEQSISALEALKAVTKYPAIQLGLGDSIGTIEKGKRANFVELGADPTAVAPANIADIAIHATWLDGVRKVVPRI
jgi:predicted amidohydrolase YtcJ